MRSCFPGRASNQPLPIMFSLGIITSRRHPKRCVRKKRTKSCARFRQAEFNYAALRVVGVPTALIGPPVHRVRSLELWPLSGQSFCSVRRARCSRQRRRISRTTFRADSSLASLQVALLCKDWPILAGMNSWRLQDSIFIKHSPASWSELRKGFAALL